MTMTEKELEDFKEQSRKNYMKINKYMKDKCQKNIDSGKCRGSNSCKRCSFNFSKFLMRGIIVGDNSLCRKCKYWFSNICHSQGPYIKQCDRFDSNKETP